MEDCARHGVVSVSVNLMSMVLRAKSCGKLVPVKVMLSYPSQFNGVCGNMLVMVQRTVWLASAVTSVTVPF